jgi:hypothetical protein
MPVPTPATEAPDAPLYWRVLRLTWVRPNGWQRALLVEGLLTVGVVLTLADVATAWTVLVLPGAGMVGVKAHDLLLGSLAGARRASPPLPPPRLSDYAPYAAVVAVVLLVRLLVHGDTARGAIVLGYALDAALSGFVYRRLLRRGAGASAATATAVLSFALPPVGLAAAWRPSRGNAEVPPVRKD